MNLQNLKICLKEAKKFKNKYPQNFSFWQLVQFFPDWQRSLNGKASPLTDEQPWITFSAIEFLKKTLKENMRVYEYGVGGSTLFFAKRVKEVVSVEHEPGWINQVSEITTTKGYKNWQGRLIEPMTDLLDPNQDPANPNGYVSSSACFQGKFFKEYAASIDKYPDNYFDVVLIDGRSRPSCFKHSLNKVKKSGFLVLDNAEREHYYYIHQQLNDLDWRKYNFYGIGPYNSYFWQTCVWQKTEDSLNPIVNNLKPSVKQ